MYFEQIIGYVDSVMHQLAHRLFKLIMLLTVGRLNKFCSKIIVSGQTYKI